MPVFKRYLIDQKLNQPILQSNHETIYFRKQYSHPSRLSLRRYIGKGGEHYGARA